MTERMTSTTVGQRPLALGFLGLGWIGRNRMEVLLENTDVQALVLAEPLAENAKLALECSRGATWAASAQEVFHNKALDGVVIATPNALHAAQCIAALEAGKAVFCQKPLGRTAQEVKTIVAASLKADKLLTVDLSYRYTKALQAVHRLIQGGEIGKVHAVDLVFHNAYGPDKAWFYDMAQSGGGCVMDLGVHLIDMALWNLGFPKIIKLEGHLYHQGTRIKRPGERPEDFASVSMLTHKGTLINMTCSWKLSAGRDARIAAVFYGAKGSAAFKNVKGSFYDFKAEKYTGTHRETLVSPPDPWGGRAGIQWVRSLQSGKGFDQASAREYIKVAEIMDRIYERQ